MKDEWQKVVFADSLPVCEDCDEPWCPEHGRHYYACDCIGPTEEDAEYKQIEGVLYARRVSNAAV